MESESEEEHLIFEETIKEEIAEDKKLNAFSDAMYLMREYCEKNGLPFLRSVEANKIFLDLLY